MSPLCPGLAPEDRLKYLANGTPSDGTRCPVSLAWMLANSPVSWLLVSSICKNSLNLIIEVSIAQTEDFVYLIGMDDVQKALKERHLKLHPLIFQRSLEKAKSNAELFDILETVPEKYPIVWDDKKRAWVFTDDLLQSRSEKVK